MATATHQTKTTTNSNRLRTASSHPNMASSLRNTVNTHLLARKTMASRLNQITRGLHPATNNTAVLPNLITAPTTKPTNSTQTIVQHNSTAPSKARLEVTTLSNLNSNTSGATGVSISPRHNPATEASISPRHSPATDPQPAQVTTRTSAKIQSSRYTITPAHSTATQTKAPTALPSPIPKIAASWELWLVARRAVSPATR